MKHEWALVCAARVPATWLAIGDHLASLLLFLPGLISPQLLDEDARLGRASGGVCLTSSGPRPSLTVLLGIRVAPAVQP